MGTDHYRFPPEPQKILRAHCTSLSTDRTADAVPDLIFQRDERWRGYRHRRLRLSHAIDHQSGDVDLAIDVVRIAFAISGKQRRAYPGNLEKVLDHSRFAQIVHQQVTLGIDVGRDVMGYLPRVVAQADPAVEGD